MIYNKSGAYWFQKENTPTATRMYIIHNIIYYNIKYYLKNDINTSNFFFCSQVQM